MKKDDIKFLLAMALTALLAGGVVYSSYLRELSVGAVQTVDIKKLEERAAKGTITLYGASYWEPVAPPREGGP